tara:strand:+ start:1038 stop:1304 length:267 start_codon:yes stop_codon:yes gene_type:complete
VWPFRQLRLPNHVLPLQEVIDRQKKQNDYTNGLIERTANRPTKDFSEVFKNNKKVQDLLDEHRVAWKKHLSKKKWDSLPEFFKTGVPD